MPRRVGELDLELLDRFIGMIPRQVRAVHVVHVGRVGIAGDELLEGLVGSLLHHPDPERARPAGQLHQFALLRWHLVGKERQAEQGDADGVEHRGRGVAAAHQARIEVERPLELLQPREQDGPVIPDDRDEGRVVANPRPLGAVQVIEGRRVLPKPELAQSPERPRRAVVRLLPGHVGKRVPALLVPVGVVVDGAEVPVAFRPGRLLRDRPLVQPDGFVDAARRAGLLGLATQRVEIDRRGARRRARRRRLAPDRRRRRGIVTSRHPSTSARR